MTAPDVPARALCPAVDLAALAARVGVAAEHVIPYGRDVAKIDLAALDREALPQAGATCRAIADELQRKGLSASVIEGALSQIDSEAEAAVALTRKKLAATRRLKADVRRRRTLALLGRKGYSAAVASQALARCWREPSPGDSPTRPGSGTGVPFALQPVRSYFLAQILWFVLESSLLETLNARRRMSAAQVCEATGRAPYRVQGLYFLRTENIVVGPDADGIYCLSQLGSDVLFARPWYELLMGGYAETLQTLSSLMADRETFSTRDDAWVGKGSCGISQYDGIEDVDRLLPDDCDRPFFVAAFTFQELIEQQGRDAVVQAVSLALARPGARLVVIEVDNRSANPHAMRDEFTKAYYNSYFLIHVLTEQLLLPLPHWRGLFADAGATILDERTTAHEIDPTGFMVGFLVRSARA